MNTTNRWNPQCHNCSNTWDDHYDHDIEPDDPARWGWNIEPNGTVTCCDCEWLKDLQKGHIA